MDEEKSILFLYVWEKIPTSAYGGASLVVVASNELEAFDIAERIINREIDVGNYFPPEESYRGSDVLKASSRPHAMYIHNRYGMVCKPGTLLTWFE